ncbi:MAG: hypothetical protein M1819_003830 [Sarea resinae]|nr:MAG: hypothetical protein M1819_003830 [Sarea resinae]
MRQDLGRKAGILLLALLASISLFYIYSHGSWPYSPSERSVLSSSHSIAPAPEQPLLDTSQEAFWPSFSELLAAARPQASIPNPRSHAYALRYQWDDSATWPEDQEIDMSHEDLEDLQLKHAWFVENMMARAPALRLPYTNDTRGIVFTAGGRFLPIMLVSLLMLRDTGTTLPVEVFMSSADEYEPAICDEVLPPLNARCVFVSDVTETSKLRFRYTKYQLKIFAILFSSFESVLFLDADDFPVRQPDELFVSEPFLSHRMVLWPDYWTSTASSQYYSIAGLAPAAFLSTPTMEAGQILVSKAHHIPALLLAAYYNTYGEFYYPLLTQDGPGQGDKDTFLAAVRVINNLTNSPFSSSSSSSSSSLETKEPYFVHTLPEPLGHPSDYTFQGYAMIQSHPSDDFCLNHHAGNTTQPASTASSLLASPSSSPSLPSPSSPPACKFPDPRPFFLHCDRPPKLDPYSLEQRDWRMYGSAADSERRFGRDIEKAVYEKMKWVACEPGFGFSAWEDEDEKHKDDKGERRGRAVTANSSKRGQGQAQESGKRSGNKTETCNRISRSYDLIFGSKTEKDGGK